LLHIIRSEQKLAHFISLTKILLARHFSSSKTVPTHTIAIVPHQSMWEEEEEEEEEEENRKENQ
jgi:hypothetical protein